MLVYVLIYLTGGVLSDCICFEDRSAANAEYSRWTREQSSDDDVLLITCDTEPTVLSRGGRIPAIGKTVASSFGEG